LLELRLNFYEKMDTKCFRNFHQQVKVFLLLLERFFQLERCNFD
jgi:hypothetical protein